ncbi:MAG TPA: proline dehydrogenase family protein [Gemmatimonadaceae bacterium]|nr:proline dehydrogenase family protein [Gemmatimonadaceae bacterium]
MAIVRSILLRASRSPWLADQFRRRKFARRAVRKFMPGEDVGAALDAAAKFSTDRMGTVITALGERVTNAAEAAAVRDHYLELLNAISNRGLPTHISVKLTHLGLDIDPELCAASLDLLATRAAEVGSYLWIDIEESWYVDPTLEMFRRTRAAHERVGLCLQAYLRRTANDLESLMPLSPAIRLVKGAYREPPEVAFPKKSDTDDSYFTLSDRMLAAAAQGRGYPVFGTHDLELIERIRTRAKTLGVNESAYEFHMLYGIKPGEQRALRDRGATVRILISYGTHWFPWYVRRLAERPANVWFVVRSMFS